MKFILSILLCANIFAQVTKSGEPLSITLPDTVFAVHGQECNIYFDNIIQTPNWQMYRYDVVCDSGTQWANRWAWTPNIAVPVSKTLTIDIYAGKTKIVSASTVIRANIANGNRKLVIIGDSFAATSTSTASSYPDEIVRLSNNTLTTIGTLGRDVAKFTSLTDTASVITYYADTLALRVIPTATDTANCILLRKSSGTMAANDTISIYSTPRTKYYTSMDSLLSGTIAVYLGKAYVPKVVWDSTTNLNYVRCVFDSNIILNTSNYYYFIWQKSGARLASQLTYSSWRASSDAYRLNGVWYNYQNSFNTAFFYQLTRTTLHEGRAGWRYQDFESNAASPFVYSSNVNFSTYLSNFNLPTPSHAIIELGTNDVFSATDANIQSTITTAFTYADSIINSMRTAGVRYIGISYVTPPSYSQDAFGTNYTTSQNTWQYRKNVHMWNTLVKARYQGVANVYLIPIYVNLDVVNNMSTTSRVLNARNSTTYTSQNNGVHPAAVGYYQLADTYYAWLMAH